MWLISCYNNIVINENFAILGALVVLFGDLTYLIETIQGRVQPNRMSWLMWGVAPLIAFAAAISQGVGISTITTFAIGAIPILIFFATFVNRKAYWKLTILDIPCGVLSALALVLWYITKDANIAVSLSILSDFAAFIPTYKKAYTHPQSESSKIFLFNAIGTGITLLSLQKWTFAAYAFPLYVMVACMVIVLLLQLKLKSKFSR